MSERVAVDGEAPGYSVQVALAPNAIEVLEQLFFNGPTWDGDVVSKSGRDDLFDLKLAGRHEGYQFLTLAGVRLALQNGLDRKKNKRNRARREEVDKFRRIAEIVNGSRDQAATAEVARPSVHAFEELVAKPGTTHGRPP